MSYNSYPTASQNYSPYYQQTVNQDRRSQYTEQSRGNNAYQQNTYQPLSAYQTNQPASSAPQSNSSGSAYHDSVHGSGAGGRQDSRTKYNDVRSSVDTTALGNLAYASSLGRDTSNLHHTIGYNRGQNTTGYSASSSCGSSIASPIPYGSMHQRPESNNATVTSRDDHSRAQSAIASPSFGYSANSGNTGYQSQQKSVVGQGQSQYASTNYQQSSEPYRVSQYSEPARPSSGQALRRPPSTTSSQSASPVVSSDQSVRLQSDGNYRRASTSKRPEQPRVPTPHQRQTQPIASPSSGNQGQFSRNVPSKEAASTATHTNAVQSSNTSAQAAAKTAPTNSFHRSNHTRTSSDSQTNGQKIQESTPKVSQFPTTVNPSQVFNDAEYQRRQATAAAEAEAARKKGQDERITALPKEHPSSIPSSASGAAGAAKKEQMEQEMKQMIEKMRDYKSKDPSLFSQIWEQVKKGQPAQQASPQVAPQGSSVSPVVVNDQLPSPVVHLPPESELSTPDAAFPPNFDRGRFPAQRRRRGGANFTPDKKQRTPKGSAKSTPTGSNLDPGNQTMQQAMAEFHRTSAFPMPATQTASQASSNNYVYPPPQEKQPTSGQGTVPGSSATPTNPANVQAQNVLPPNPNEAPPVSTTGPIPGSSATPTPPTNPQAPSKPSPPQSGGTYWPENKKRQLAEAARNALISSPKNHGKQITADEIHQLLDQNPSYTQMCEILEYRGFVIDRGQFARLLLSSVPDLGAASAQKSSGNPPQHSIPTVPTAQMTTGPPPDQNGQGGIPRPMPYSAPQSQPGYRYVTPYPNSSQPGQYTIPQAQMTQYPPNPAYIGHGVLYPHAPQYQTSQPPTVGHPPKPNVRWSDLQHQAAAINNKPVSTPKQDMARKRSFGDIVDLTQATSDDEDETPNQRPRTDDGSALRVYAAGRSVKSGTATPTSVKDAVSAGLEEYRYKPTGQDEYLRAQDIVRPMNKRQDALRRSSYNPKTIARDILLAIGKHPTMAPLNAHLDDLRERFTAVNYESDLATFRWDLVDPGGPALVQEATVDEDSHQSRRSSRMAVVSGGNKSSNVEPGLRYNQPFKPTRVGHFASNSRQPATEKTQTSPQTAQHITSTPTSRGGITRTSLSDSGFSRFVHNDLPVMLNGITGPIPRTNNGQFSAPTTPASSATKVRVTGHVGRPPGAKNRNPRPDRGTSRKPRTSMNQQQNASTRNETTPVSNGNQAAPYETSNENNASPTGTPANPLRTRPRISTTPARPSSLQNAMTPADGIAVVIPSRSPSVMENNSPAASIRSSSKNIAPFPASKPNIKQSPAPSTSYRVYKCQWDKCPAELHNLDILKKHMRKHRSEDEFKLKARPCLWRGCSTYNSTRPNFGSVEEWDTHVLSKHVEPADEEEVAREEDEEPAENASDCSLPPPVRTNKEIKRGRTASGVPSPARPMVVLCT